MEFLGRTFRFHYVCMMRSERFREHYEKLNQKQKQAVDSIEGPVMVVAGPGTGKTQILAVRIANILETTDTSPYQILCLTYTDAGVVAMRERLLSIIGPTAYNVNIHTFHSLCNEIIQFNSSYFGHRNLRPAGDLDVYEILREMIDELPAGHLLKRTGGDAYYEADDLMNLFGILKNEHFDPAIIHQRADKYLRDKEDNGDFTYKTNGKGYKKGDKKEKDYRQEKLRMDKLKAAVELFPVFKSKMQERKLYDFSDMILWVLDAFRNDPDFLLIYQERFLYFLVDEFQDTNGSQLELINYLTSYWEVPNIFVVGDEDQSIYRFQGANIGNILNFASFYEGKLSTVVLTDNYRSTQPVLDASRALIELNTSRIPGVEKVLLARAETDPAAPRPSIRSYFNPLHETVAVGQAILELHKQGVPYTSVAVLYRNHRHVEDLLRFFEANGIPYSSKKKVNILDELLVRKLLSILRYIDAEMKRPYSGEDLLFEILNYDFYGVLPLDLAKISAEIRKKRVKWRDHLEGLSKDGQDLFSGQAGRDSITELKRLASDLEYWIGLAPNLTVPQLVEKLIAKGGVLSYVMKSDTKRWQMQILRTFFDFVKEEAVRNPVMSLGDLLERVETYSAFGIPIEAMQVLHVPDSVNLMTMHGSKGLEFDHVFIIRAVDSDWIRKKGSARDYYLSRVMAEQIGEDSDIEEVRRLMYVGMTRARKRLHISTYSSDMNSREVSRLQFLAELEEQAGLKQEACEVPESDIMAFEEVYYRDEEIPPFELLDHDYLDILLEDYTLSATHLNAYLKCPLSFYFDHVLRVPSAKSESASFGTAIHAALEELFRIYQKEERMPDAKELLTYFEKSMYLNRDSFTEKGYRRYLEHGKNILPPYYDLYKKEWEKEKVYTVEKNITRVVLKSVPMKGKLDRIVFEGNEAYVIDFKTGKVENAKKKCKPPSGKEDAGTHESKYGGDYWRQMIFYHLLIENDRSNNWTMSSGEMNFVEPGKHGEYHREVFRIHPDEVSIVREQIRETYMNIKAHEFSRGCGEDYCHWCNFVRYYLKGQTMVNESLPGSHVEEES